MTIIVSSSIFKLQLKETWAIGCNVLWCSYESERHNRGRLNATEQRSTVARRLVKTTCPNTDTADRLVFVSLP